MSKNRILVLSLLAAGIAMELILMAYFLTGGRGNSKIGLSSPIAKLSIPNQNKQAAVLEGTPEQLAGEDGFATGSPAEGYPDGGVNSQLDGSPLDGSPTPDPDHPFGQEPDGFLPPQDSFPLGDANPDPGAGIDGSGAVGGYPGPDGSGEPFNPVGNNDPYPAPYGSSGSQVTPTNAPSAAPTATTAAQQPLQPTVVEQTATPTNPVPPDPTFTTAAAQPTLTALAPTATTAPVQPTEAAPVPTATTAAAQPTEPPVPSATSPAGQPNLPTATAGPAATALPNATALPTTTVVPTATAAAHSPTAGQPGTMISIPVQAAPALDGDGSDPAWATVPALVITTSAGANQSATRVSVQSVYDGQTIYFLLRWADPTQSFLRLPWQKQQDGSWKILTGPNSRDGDENVYFEDQLALLWQPSSRLEKRLDLWQWRSVSGTGQVDDGYLDGALVAKESPAAGFRPDPNTGGGARLNQSKDHKSPAYMLPGSNHSGAPGYILDAGKVKLDDRLFSPGDLVPGILTAPWQGDRGDLQARWSYSSGTWMLEFSRRLVTGSMYDVQFDDLSKAYPFSLASFDNTQLRPAIQNGVTALIFQK